MSLPHVVMNLSHAIELYDVTPRDGDQASGINLSTADKLAIARIDASLGIPFVETGFPESNDVDRAVFQELKAHPLQGTKHAAFGMTRRAGVAAERDPGLRALIGSGAPALTVVGKSSRYQVEKVLRTTVNENIAMIRDSIQLLSSKSNDVTYDAEHFFDAWCEDPEYALRTLQTALESGAKRIVLCDTNGGRTPDLVGRAVSDVRRSFSGALIGIHPHDDRNLAMANMLAAVQEGARHVQGTWNGHGERVGNLDLGVAIANLHHSGYETLSKESLATLTPTSRQISRIQRQPLDPRQAFLGDRVASHSGGMHISAVARTNGENPRGNAYEFFDPTTLGNERSIVASKQGGRSLVVEIAKSSRLLSPELRDRFLHEPALQVRAADAIKSASGNGINFGAGMGSLDLLLLAQVKENLAPTFTEVSAPKVIDTLGLRSEASMKMNVHGTIEHTVAEGNGTIDALFQTLRKALAGRLPETSHVSLVDFHVDKLPISAEGSASLVQVSIEFANDADQWSTTSVSSDMLQASWTALKEGFEWYCMRKQMAADGRTD